MDDKTQRERLEQELRFLKESFEADVISKEEYEKGKDRIEKKLREIKHAEKEQIGDEAKKEAPENQEKIEETKDVGAIESKEGKKIKLNVIQDETFEEQQEQIQVTEQKEPPKVQEPKIEINEDKNEGKFFKYAIVFIVLALIIFFSYSFIKEKKATDKTKEVKSVAEPKETPKTNVIILNDRKNCFNCETQRVLSILENWFEVINVKEVDYSTNEGKILAERLDARLLPLYILDENITKKQSFEQFKKLFVKKDNSYLLSEDAVGSTFYFKRDNIPNKLDLFIISNDESSAKAEKNLKEFLETFKEAKFEKHLSDSNLAKELDIKTFPTFLVNNQVKFSGVHPTETIKENFCQLNKLKECEKSLSKSLI